MKGVIMMKYKYYGNTHTHTKFGVDKSNCLLILMQLCIISSHSKDYIENLKKCTLD